jgi:hypothetical protein
VVPADDELSDGDGAGEDGAGEDGAAVDGGTDPEGDGSAEAVVPGSVLGEPLGAPLGSAAEPEVLADGDGDKDADGDGDGDGDGDAEGHGDGEEVAEGDGDGAGEDGSSWHLVSVLAAAAVVTSRTESAWAMPDQAASMLTIRKPPASRLSVIARICAKRI